MPVLSTSTKRRGAAIVAGVVLASSFTAMPLAQAETPDSYQLPEPIRPIPGTNCVPFPRNHAIHADVSGLPATPVSAGLLSRFGDGHASMPVSIASDPGVSSTTGLDSFAATGSPVNQVTSTAPRARFRLGYRGTFQWGWGFWQFDKVLVNDAGNLPDHAMIPIPAGSGAWPNRSGGVAPDNLVIQADPAAPLEGDRHFSVIETDECASYEAFSTVRPNDNFLAHTNNSNWVGDNTWSADLAVRWPLAGARSLDLAYRDPDFVVPRTNGPFYPFRRFFDVHGNLQPVKDGSTLYRQSPVGNPDNFRTSDAASLPTSMMVLRHEDLEGGQLQHALRFVLPQGLIKPAVDGIAWPAGRSDGNATGADREVALRMGSWLRLRADVGAADLSSSLSADCQTLTSVQLHLIEGLKRHGLVLADSGGPNQWGFDVDPDNEWTSCDREVMRAFTLGQMEVVNDASVVRDPALTTEEILKGASWFRIR